MDKSKSLRLNLPGIMLDTFEFLMPGLNDALGSDEFVELGQDSQSIFQRLYNDVMGINAQEREFNQQEYLQDKMNEYNTPENQMQRLIDAGFSRDMAAQSVLGGNATESAQAPSVSNATGAGAAGLGALSSAAAAPAQVGSLIADANAKNAAANLDNANAAAVETRVKNESMQMVANLVTSFTKAGLSEISAGLLALDIVNGGPNRIVEYLQCQEGIRIVDAELKLLEDQHNRNLIEIGKLDEQIEAAIDLDTKKALQAEKEAALAQENANWQKLQNDAWKDCPGYNLPGFNQLRMAKDSDTYDKVGRAIFDASYQESSGKFSAEVDNAYEKMYNEVLGKNEADSEYADLKQFFDLNEYWVKSTIDLMSKQPNGLPDPAKYAMWVLEALMHAGIGNGAIVRPPKSVPKPHTGSGYIAK